MATSHARPSTPEDRDGVSAELPVGNGGQHDMATTNSERSRDDMASSDVKRSTSDGRGGKGGRRGSTTPTKTKRSKVTKALIVCDRWGPSIHGGVTDGLHLAIRLLQNMGISVHCTALQATEEEELEAEELGVNLELPTKTAHCNSDRQLVTGCCTITYTIPSWKN
ncbi:uncharacterized protein [Ptychodera flava]|uniref:uncharacterized protein n=1 Tax=Ptychodera flava TaxID=63121 RepID=UPI00396A3ED1